MSAVILCRCCGKPAQVDEQKRPNGGMLLLITCWNREERCDLCGYTFTSDDYQQKDLSAYTWREKVWSYD